MKFRLILVLFIILEIAEASNSTTTSLPVESDVIPMWINILKLLMEKSEKTSGSCVTLYNFESYLTKEIHESKEALLGGLFTAETLTEKLSRNQRRKPLCSNFLAKFASINDAIAFTEEENESGQFLKTNSLAVIFVAETLTMNNLSQLFDMGTFGRAPQLTIFAEGEKNDSMKLFARDLSSVVTHSYLIARWNYQQQSFMFGQNDIFSVELKNFNGQILQIATFDYAPFTTSKPALNGEKPIFDGIEMTIVNEVSKALNFNYKLNEPKSGSKFQGVVSDLQGRLADIGVSHLFQVYDRVVQMNLDTSTFISMDHYVFLVPPAKMSPQWMVLLLPFDITTWVALVATLLSCMFFAFVLSKLYKYSELVFEDYVFTYLAMLSQEWWIPTLKIRSQGLRIHLAFALVSLFILTTAYKGSYFSLIFSPIQAKPLETWEEVLDSDLNVYSISGVLQTNLNNESDPKLLRLAKKSGKHGDIAGALTNVSNGLQVLTESEQMSQYRINLDFIDSLGQPKVHVSERVSHYAVVLYFQEGSPYREPMSKVLESLVEAGISYKVLEDALSRMEVKNIIRGPEKLALKGAMPAFVIIILFGTISFIVFIVEIMLLMFSSTHNRNILCI